MADGIMNKDQLLSLTLRQLRQEASKLSVPLYSRKTKAVLVDLILGGDPDFTSEADLNDDSDLTVLDIVTLISIVLNSIYTEIKTTLGSIFFLSKDQMSN